MSLVVGAIAFAATLVYLIDRLGWILGLLLGWAPALVLGLVAAGGHLAVASTLWRAPARRASLTTGMEAQPVVAVP